MNKNAYIIDIESFIFPYHPSLQNLTLQERKAIDNGHIVEATTKILDFLRERNIKLTFAVVAEIYEWFPDLIERIANESFKNARIADVMCNLLRLHNMGRSLHFWC